MAHLPVLRAADWRYTLDYSADSLGRMSKMGNQTTPLISPAEFLLGIRHSAYRTLASAIAELVDNAIEAKANKVEIVITKDTQDQPVVQVLDDGAGMTPTVLKRCLQFGGTTRFDSRQGMGRFGLGLPMSSFSYARRVTVCSWRGKYRGYQCHLDMDEVSGGSISIENPEKMKVSGRRTETGTLVTWEKCDRINPKRFPSILSGISVELGRRFRSFLSNGLEISVNGASTVAVDPLMRVPDEFGVRATAYGSEVKLAIRPQSGSRRVTAGEVSVRFTELPVKKWFSLSPVEKRQKGISRRAGVSILRAGREVDFGWFFMGEKRRENYDDWWRCEIEFSPILDEEFGISHTKQQIRPSEDISEIITLVVEPVARTLASRARKAHEELVGQNVAGNRLIEVAQRVERFITDDSPNNTRSIEGFEYSVESTARPSPELYSPVLADGILTLLLNSAHEYFRRIVKIADGGQEHAGVLKSHGEVLLLAAARAEIAASSQDAAAIKRFRAAWGRTLSAYLAG